ncbi:MAG: prolyl oligopeptidase family serine peptidase [Saprospiraceae bacterium]|nr:prolyl oligopeptidase family serine peptidase [Saprospiraceae bacterium]
MRIPVLFVFCLICIMITSNLSIGQIVYPSVRIETFDTTIYGKNLNDPYFWMSRKANEKELINFCHEQNTLTHSLIDSIPGDDKLMAAWGEAFSGLEDELWSVHTVGEMIYYNREIPGEGIWLCRRKSANAPEEKVLGKLSIHGQKYSIRKKVFAHEKSLLALILTQNGEANPHIRIFDLDKKEFLPDSIGRVMFNDSRGVSMTWLPNDAGLLYTQAPPTEKESEVYYNGKIKLHIIGNDPERDEAIFGIGLNSNIKLKAYETPYVYSFKNSPYIVARIRAGDADNYAFAVHCSKLKGAQTPWKKLKGYVNLGDGFDGNGKFLFAVTKGGPNYRVVKINMETGSKPETVLKNTPDVIAPVDAGNSTGIVAGKDVLYVLIRKIGDMQLMKIDYSSNSSSLLPMKSKGAIGDLNIIDDNDLIFASGSAIQSVKYMHYNYKEQQVAPLPFADKAFDLSHDLKTQILWIPSRDGKSIPVSLVYSKHLVLQNKNPLLIEAYGNSGASNDLFFNPTIIPWIKLGGIFAYAHVRGGGEMGEAWMKDGQFPNKMNSINDVVDVADWFIENEYTSASKQLVMGGSAGSFLVGMSINQRPELFAGGLFLSGLPDIVTYQDGAFARESKSVGPIGTKAGFLSSLSVSSYYNVPKNQKLPAMLIVHGGTDYILGLHPAARYTAKLQQEQRGEKPILLLVDWESGHLGSELENLYIYKFALWQTGHPDFQPK